MYLRFQKQKLGQISVVELKSVPYRLKHIFSCVFSTLKAFINWTYKKNQEFIIFHKDATYGDRCRQRHQDRQTGEKPIKSKNSYILDKTTMSAQKSKNTLQWKIFM